VTTVIPVETLPLEAQLADAMRDGLAVFDPSGRLVRWNSSARAITGWTPGEAGQRGLAALPAGVFFLFLGLGATVDDDTLRRLLLYVAGISLLLALFFLLRAPAQVRPHWLLEPEPKPEPKPEPSEDGPQV